MQSINQFTFTHNGAEYVARVYADDSHGAPRSGYVIVSN